MRIITTFLSAILGFGSAVILHFIIFGVSVSPPNSIMIPDINLKTQVEQVGLNEKKAMADPANENNVAWYRPGVKPGEKGNAVIAGHYDDEDGPSVFYNLAELDIGDTIIITDEKGKEHTFIVKNEEIYSKEAFPISKVFGKADNKNLNLITCEGTFDKKSQDYSHRLVIYAELDESTTHFDTYAFMSL